MPSGDIQQAQQRQENTIRSLYDHFEVNKPYQVNYHHVADQIGVSSSIMQRTKKAMVGAGILKAEVTYRSGAEGSGRIGTWTLLCDRDEAIKRYRKYGYQKEEKKRKPASKHDGNGVALASDRDPGELRAVAGPDAPSPFDALRHLRKNEAYALVEAARQYRDRYKVLAQHLKALEEAGIKLKTDVETAFGDSAENDRLEIVGLVLPYIEIIEAQLEAQIRRNVEMNKRLEPIEREVRDLRTFRDRRLRAEVAASQ